MVDIDTSSRDTHENSITDLAAVNFSNTDAIPVVRDSQFLGHYGKVPVSSLVLVPSVLYFMKTFPHTLKVCVCVCVCVCLMGVCMCICVYLCLCMRESEFLRVCVCVCLWL